MREIKKQAEKLGRRRTERRNGNGKKYRGDEEEYMDELIDGKDERRQKEKE